MQTSFTSPLRAFAQKKQSTMTIFKAKEAFINNHDREMEAFRSPVSAPAGARLVDDSADQLRPAPSLLEHMLTPPANTTRTAPEEDEDLGGIDLKEELKSNGFHLTSRSVPLVINTFEAKPVNSNLLQHMGATQVRNASSMDFEIYDTYGNKIRSISKLATVFRTWTPEHQQMFLKQLRKEMLVKSHTAKKQPPKSNHAKEARTCNSQKRGRVQKKAWSPPRDQLASFNKRGSKEAAAADVPLSPLALLSNVAASSPTTPLTRLRRPRQPCQPEEHQVALKLLSMKEFFSTCQTSATPRGDIRNGAISITDEAGKVWFVLGAGTYREKKDGKTVGWHVPATMGYGQTRPMLHVTEHFNLPKKSRAASCLTWDEAVAADMIPDGPGMFNKVEIGEEMAIDMHC